MINFKEKYIKPTKPYEAITSPPPLNLHTLSNAIHVDLNSISTVDLQIPFFQINLHRPALSTSSYSSPMTPILAATSASPVLPP
ncbi:hypothetical protein Leryth_015753 [Lithospermum erythrorhizon]|nr:hypothetical protein Leryth_015753 [Lithospermum erythrorhizon]